MGSKESPSAETEDAIQYHNDSRDAVAETSRHEPGSDSWWEALTAARKENSDHMGRRRARPSSTSGAIRRWPPATSLERPSSSSRHNTPMVSSLATRSPNSTYLEVLEQGRLDVGLSLGELWFRYFELGG